MAASTTMPRMEAPTAKVCNPPVLLKKTMLPRGVERPQNPPNACLRRLTSWLEPKDVMDDADP